jgi:hypothetical protein
MFKSGDRIEAVRKIQYGSRRDGYKVLPGFVGTVINKPKGFKQKYVRVHWDGFNYESFKLFGYEGHIINTGDVKKWEYKLPEVLFEV